MIWVDDLVGSIRGSGIKHKYVEPLALAVAELSAICDRHATDAPMPDLDRDPVGALQIGWDFAKRNRSLTLGLDFNGNVYLLLIDGGKSKYSSPYTPLELERAVESFFYAGSAP